MSKNPMIYLDHNATTPVKYAVRVAMSNVMDMPYNASSVHRLGRAAKAKIDEAREHILDMAGAQGHTLIFTSCGTEANNLALRGFKEADSYVISAVEHVSVLKAGSAVSGGMVPVNEKGMVELDVLKTILANSKGRTLVSVMMANNETGIIQPIKEIASLVVGTGGFVHCDASQAFGKIPVDFNALGVDMMTISPHKFGGPQGVGALIVKKGLEIKPLLLGGGQEGRMRGGTENLPGIVGFGAAAQVITRKMPSDLRDYLESEIKAYAPEAIIIGEHQPRLPNTSCIAMPGMSSQTQLIAFDLDNIAVSNGSACSSGTVQASHVLKAMGFERDITDSAIRVSLGADSVKEEVDAFLRVWKRNYDNVTNKTSVAA